MLILSLFKAGIKKPYLKNANCFLKLSSIHKGMCKLRPYMRIVERKLQRPLERFAYHSRLVVKNAAQRQQIVHGTCMTHRRLPLLAKLWRLAEHGVAHRHCFAYEQEEEDFLVWIAWDE